jgi:hypothetical protein
MKLEIGDHLAFLLAKDCAETVRARVFEQHRILLGEQEAFAPPSSYADAWLEMRALVRSFQTDWERKGFVSLVKFLFQDDRKERGYPIRGRDHVRAVIRCGNADLVKPGSRFYDEAQEWIELNKKEAA